MTSDCPPIRDDGPLGAGWDHSLPPPEVGPVPPLKYWIRLSSTGSAIQVLDPPNTDPDAPLAIMSGGDGLAQGGPVGDPDSSS